MNKEEKMETGVEIDVWCGGRHLALQEKWGEHITSDKWGKHITSDK
jgi:hypothetical protein